MKVGFACGVFDVFHAGHVLMLKECKEHCDYLIVAVNRAGNISSEINPGKKKPVFSFDERKMVVANSRYVDQVLEYNSEEELYQILKSNKINVRFLGDDYKGKNITGGDLNIPIHYVDRSHGFSTTKAIEKILKNRGS
ncbi:MAG: adenylyltransferase/cytidyltransferase family protein [Chitinophagaceae bacterium]|nr:adenylyltransferase/cytidyltransferase family protein [Chitinophagaceae bacterium]